MKQRKIYIATSWKQEIFVSILAKRLREAGHKVFAFCEETRPDGLPSFVFDGGKFSEQFSDGPPRWDTFCDFDAPKKAFKCDKMGLDWADTIVLVLPSGRSAHLEAGYAVGRGKDLVIYGQLPDGEFDVMYGFAQRRIHAFIGGGFNFNEELIEVLAGDLPRHEEPYGKMTLDPGDTVRLDKDQTYTEFHLNSVNFSPDRATMTLMLQKDLQKPLEVVEPANGLDGEDI